MHELNLRSAVRTIGLLGAASVAVAALAVRAELPSYGERAEETATSDLRLLAAAIVRHEARHGPLPAARGLPALLDAGLLPGGLRSDPWGTPYRYFLGATLRELRSDGPDRLPGTADDLVRTDVAAGATGGEP